MSKGLRMAEDYQNIVSILQGLGAVPESLMRPPEHQLRGCGTGEGLGDPDDLKEGTPWL